MKGKGPTQTVTLYCETLFTPSHKTYDVDPCYVSHILIPTNLKPFSSSAEIYWELNLSFANFESWKCEDFKAREANNSAEPKNHVQLVDRHSFKRSNKDRKSLFVR
ncbi:hypothetical protein PGT21_014360 [Puccinia graminis f. sp. tritici]|uniref:Uncharacterized protein n=1 Tax=Puccinia graminis f. sp. tritici TaxID=56615 RepID=A0A5B0Q5X6_PUCGR|nr:hypothetical protein PGT21_014360 [Puccinia graminis f. sp. tritici]